MSTHEVKNRNGRPLGCLAMTAIVAGVTVLLAIAAVVAIAAFSRQFSGGHSHRYVAAAKLEGGEDEVPLLQEVWSSGASAGTKVVRISLSGMIMLNDDGWMDDAASATAALRAIQRATHDTSVQGIILEVDSGGGGITASDMIYQALQTFKKAQAGRKIVTLMGDIAASGAYYISLPSDTIVAHPTTITGSIGVIMQTYNIKELAAKIGIRDETFKSGANKDILNPFHDVTPEQRAMMQGVIDALHSRFVTLVAQARKLDEAEVRKLADGRIFVADEALARKLVDVIGYRTDAEQEMRKLLQADQINVVRYTESGSWLDLFGSRRGFGMSLGAFLKPRETRLMYRWWL
jgi:protease-4